MNESGESRVMLDSENNRSKLTVDQIELVRAYQPNADQIQKAKSSLYRAVVENGVPDTDIEVVEWAAKIQEVVGDALTEPGASEEKKRFSLLIEASILAGRDPMPIIKVALKTVLGVKTERRTEYETGIEEKRDRMKLLHPYIDAVRSSGLVFPSGRGSYGDVSCDFFFDSPKHHAEGVVLYAEKSIVAKGKIRIIVRGGYNTLTLKEAEISNPDEALNFIREYKRLNDIG